MNLGTISRTRHTMLRLMKTPPARAVKGRSRKSVPQTLFPLLKRPQKTIPQILFSALFALDSPRPPMATPRDCGNPAPTIAFPTHARQSTLCHRTVCSSNRCHPMSHKGTLCGSSPPVISVAGQLVLMKMAQTTPVPGNRSGERCSRFPVGEW